MFSAEDIIATSSGSDTQTPYGDNILGNSMVGNIMVSNDMVIINTSPENNVFIDNGN